MIITSIERNIGRLHAYNTSKNKLEIKKNAQIESWILIKHKLKLFYSSFHHSNINVKAKFW